LLLIFLNDLRRHGANLLIAQVHDFAGYGAEDAVCFRLKRILRILRKNNNSVVVKTHIRTVSSPKRFFLTDDDRRQDFLLFHHLARLRYLHRQDDGVAYLRIALLGPAENLENTPNLRAAVVRYYHQ